MNNTNPFMGGGNPFMGGAGFDPRIFMGQQAAPPPQVQPICSRCGQPLKVAELLMNQATGGLVCRVEPCACSGGGGRRWCGAIIDAEVIK